MPTCICGTKLEGRRRKCDSCKAGPNKTGPGPGHEMSSAGHEMSTPPGLHSRGAALWKTLGLSLDSAAGQLALEACRAADRLDELDSVIAGKGVLNLMQFRTHLDLEDILGQHDLTVEVKFQSVLAEARGQQANFAGLLAAIEAKTKGVEKPVETPKAPAATPLDQLRERRRSKEAQ